MNEEEAKRILMELSTFDYVKLENGDVAIETVLNLLEKKDEMIELMLEEISKNIINTCPFADYNVDLDCENKCKDDYKACWEKYFERKAENGN